jgi:hypothetical protein
MEQARPRHVGHREHVGQPVWLWALGLVITASVAFAYLGFVGPVWAGLILVVSTGVLAWLLWNARILVAVDDDAFVAGPARLPLEFVGEVTPLDAANTRRVSGVDADARAFLLLRGSVHTAVRVEVDDPADPTPYWLVSTAHPDRLAAALVAARDARRSPDGERSRDLG